MNFQDCMNALLLYHYLVSMRILIVWVVIICGLWTAHGWGGDAHRVTAKIASQFLRHSTKVYLWQHIGGPSIKRIDKKMIEESIWADTIEDTHPWASELHFSHTPYQACAPFDFDRDCGFDHSGRCVVSGIANYTQRAMDPSLSESHRAEAIKLIIHLFADLHNPMHVGFAKDFGGTALSVTYLDNFEQTTSLHEVWDSVLVEQLEIKIAKEVDPWTLSMNLLESLQDEADTAPFSMNIQSRLFESHDAILTIVSDIATEISMSYTCNLAYKNAIGDYIQNGENLNEEYISTRGIAVEELLKKAGIRLAEFLNTIASIFNSRKISIERTEAYKEASEDLKLSLRDNMFFLLAGEFDAENLLFTGSQTTSIPLDDEFESEHPEKEIIVVPTRRAFPKSVKITTTTISPEEAKRLKNIKKRQRAKRAARLVEGVDLDNVVLIKRRGAYIVTGAHLASADYFPNLYDVFRVSFSGNSDSATPIQFVFDAAFFGMQQYSPRLVGEALMRISKTPFTDSVIEEMTSMIDDTSTDEEGGGSLFFEKVLGQEHPVNNLRQIGDRIRFHSTMAEADVEEMIQKLYGYKPFVEHKASDDNVASDRKKEMKKAKRERAKQNKILRAQFGGVLPTDEQLWEAQVTGQLSNICVYEEGTIFFYAHEDTMTAKDSPPIIASMFRVHADPSMKQLFWFIVDHKIFKGNLTDSITRMFGSLLKRIGSKKCRDRLKNRPTLHTELSDLDYYHHSKDLDRYKKLKAIRIHHAKPADADSSYFKFYWSIHATEPFDLPATLGF